MTTQYPSLLESLKNQMFKNLKEDVLETKPTEELDLVGINQLKEDEFIEYDENKDYNTDELNSIIKREMLKNIETLPAQKDEELKQEEEEVKEEKLIDIFKFHYKDQMNENLSNDNQRKNINMIDPNLRLQKLTKDLAQVSYEINEYITHYNDNIILKETENFEQVLKDLDTYKEKLSKLLTSEAYNNMDNSDKKKDIKEEIKNNLGEYTKCSNKLLELINKEKHDFNSNSNLIENYQLCAFNSKEDEKELNDLINNENNKNNNKSFIDAISDELLKKIQNLEKILFSDNEKNNIVFEKSIIQEVKTLIDFCNNKLDKSIDARKKIIDDFNKEISEDIQSFSKEDNCLFKINELYYIMGLYETFDESFQYIKKRLKAIITIHEESDKFGDNIKKLNNKINDNEKALKEFGEKYASTLNEFDNIQSILQSLIQIEGKLGNILVDE